MPLFSRKNPLIGMGEGKVRDWLAHHQHSDWAELAKEWLNRRGPFAEMAPSEPDAEAVFPGPDVEDILETHGAEGKGEYHDGS